MTITIHISFVINPLLLLLIGAISITTLVNLTAIKASNIAEMINE